MKEDVILDIVAGVLGVLIGLTALAQIAFDMGYLR